MKINDELIYPDLIVVINAGVRKQCEPDYENNFFIGPPNIVLDILDDLKLINKERKNLFPSAGVEECLIINEDLTKVEWNRLAGNQFKQIQPDKEKSLRVPVYRVDIC